MSHARVTKSVLATVGVILALALPHPTMATEYKVCDSAHGCCIMSQGGQCDVNQGYRLYLTTTKSCLNGLPFLEFGSPGGNSGTGESMCLGTNGTSGIMFNYLSNSYSGSMMPGIDFTVQQSGGTAKVTATGTGESCIAAPDNGVPCCTIHGFFKICIGQPGTEAACHGLRTVTLGRTSDFPGVETCLLEVDSTQPEGSKTLFTYVDGSNTGTWGDQFTVTEL